MNVSGRNHKVFPKFRKNSMNSLHLDKVTDWMRDQLNVKRANKTYAVIVRRERELRTRIKRGVPGRKWFAMRIKWRLDSNLFKHKRYSLTC